MYGRISFSNQKIHKEMLLELEKMVGENIENEQMVYDHEDELVDFYDWRHTFDIDKVDQSKRLVRKSDYIKLKESKEYLCNIQTLMSTFPNIKFTVRGLIENNASMGNMLNTLHNIESKFLSMLKEFDNKIEFNQKCNVHVPNLGMLNINQLGYATDKCTEELQELLNNGWRILTICPQPNQRRSDYILGRTLSNHDGNESLKCLQF